MLSKDILDKNIERTIEGILVQVAHAQSVNGKERTGYYKVAILLAASVVEALLYYLLEKTENESGGFFNKASFRKDTKLGRMPKAVNSSKELWVVSVEEKPFKLRGSTFDSMIKFCDETGFLNKKLIDNLDYSRIKRNKIHLQTLDSTEYRFNSKMLERVSNVILQLYKKIDD